MFATETGWPANPKILNTWPALDSAVTSDELTGHPVQSGRVRRGPERQETSSRALPTGDVEQGPRGAAGKQPAALTPEAQGFPGREAGQAITSPQERGPEAVYCPHTQSLPSPTVALHWLEDSEQCKALLPLHPLCEEGMGIRHKPGEGIADAPRLPRRRQRRIGQTGLSTEPSGQRQLVVGIHGEKRSEKPSKENPHGPLRDDRGMNEGHRGKLQRKGFLMSVRKR